MNSSCGRGMPRKVAFCPYCGARQAAAPAPEPVRPEAPAVPVAPPVVEAPAAATIAPPADTQPAPPAPPPPPPPPTPPPTEPAPAAAPQAKPKVDLGRKPQHTPPPPQAPQPPLPDSASRAAPPLRQPIRMRTWLMVLVALAAIWLFAKPGDVSKKNVERVDAAVALTAECKISEARAELTALKSAKANAAQVKRLQSAISETAPACEKKRLRAAAWDDARSAVEAALSAGSLDKAAGRLAAFTRRWDDDADTRELGDRIDSRKAERLLDEADACLARSDRVCLENRLLAAERLQRPEMARRIQALREALSRLLESSLLGAPQAAPMPAPAAAPPVLGNEPPRAAVPAPPRVITTAPAPGSQSAQQVRKILSDAERELAQGNYRSAIDKLDICATMIDVGNRECLALKQKADRLNREMLRCVAGGNEWINHRCN